MLGGAARAKKGDTMTLDEAAREVLAAFDFGAVAKAMRALDWCYGDHDEPPTFGELYQTAERLVTGAVNDAKAGCLPCWHESGGFSAHVYSDTRSEIVVNLAFIVTETCEAATPAPADDGQTDLEDAISSAG